MLSEIYFYAHKRFYFVFRGCWDGYLAWPMDHKETRNLQTSSFCFLIRFGKRSMKKGSFELVNFSQITLWTDI